MEFKYQKYPYDKAVKLAHVKSERVPLLIDYSDKYTYNQPRAIDEIIYTNGAGFTYDGVSDVFSIGGVGYAIGNDEIEITTKTTHENIPLYYQYQPKFDVVHPENIKIFNKDGNEIEKYIEYGYLSDDAVIKGDHHIFSNNSEYEFDPLDGRTDIGELNVAFFDSIEAIEDDGGGTYDNIPFNVYGYCLSKGGVVYDHDLIPEDGVIEFYTAIREIPVGADKVYIIRDSTPDWEVWVESDGKIHYTGDVGGIVVDPYKWFRLKLDFSAKTIRVYSNLTNTSAAFAALALTSSHEFEIFGESVYSFDLAIFDEYPAGDIAWTVPLYAHRYGKSLYWHTDVPTATQYRIRILLPDSERYIIQYDAIDNDSTEYKNKVEWVSQELLYKKYSDVASNDWHYDSSSIIYFDAHFYDDLTMLESEIGLANINIYTKPTEKSRVMTNIHDEKILIRSGLFNSDDYSVPSGILDYYYVPEYENMPFASDNQVVIDPKYMKRVKKKADIVDAHTFEIGTFYFYEGNYPDYVIPNTVEKSYDVSSDIISDLTDATDLDYRNARGINIYINNVLIDNTEISNYNMSQGLIRLNLTLKINDDVRVTYLEKLDGFVAPYPRLDRFTSEWDSYRIYLRANFPNYGLEFPTDESERACYQEIVDGAPSGILRSCLTNDEVIKDINDDYIPLYSYTPSGVHPNYEIADVTMIEVIVIDDAREIGGGIKEDDYFGSIEERLTEFPFSQAYVDIMNAYGIVVPGPIAFIKIESTLMNNLIDNYISEGKTRKDAIDYLKRHIDKHMGLGIMYCIIDENYELIDEAFPPMEVRTNG